MGSVFDWMTVAKAAEALEVSERTIYNYIQKGQLVDRLEGKQRFVSRKDVKALIDAKTNGVSRAVNALMVQRLDAEVQVLKKQVETLMRLFDLRYDTLDLNEEDMTNLFDMATHHMSHPWAPHEEAMYCDVFVRLRLEDLEKVARPEPWRPFLSLSKIMFEQPYNPDNKSLLTAGKENMEKLAFVWANKVDRTTASELNHKLHKDGVLERRMDRRLETIQQKIKSKK